MTNTIFWNDEIPKENVHCICVLLIKQNDYQIYWCWVNLNDSDVSDDSKFLILNNCINFDWDIFYAIIFYLSIFFSCSRNLFLGQELFSIQ